LFTWRAAAKSVSVTDLTITEARELLAKKKAKATTTAKNTTETADEENSYEQSDDPEPEEQEDQLEDFLNNIGPDELFTNLKGRWEDEDLHKLAQMLVNHLGAAIFPTKGKPAATEPSRRLN
jgi:hypothetical protein